MSKESNWNRSLLSKREKVEKEQKEQTKKELFIWHNMRIFVANSFFKLQNNN